jgi:hypothetical protein
MIYGSVAERTLACLAQQANLSKSKQIAHFHYLLPLT